MVLAIDDLNLPFRDEFECQPSIQMIRQLVDFREIFSREALEERKKVEDLLLVACYSYRSGRSLVDLRLHRHLLTLVMPFQSPEDIKALLLTFLRPRFEAQPDLEKLCEAAVMLCHRLSRTAQFASSSTKFHYNFRLRELFAFCKGLLLFKQPIDRRLFLKLWAHEILRTLEDKLESLDDCSRFREIAQDMLAKSLPEASFKDILRKEYWFSSLSGSYTYS
jgi:hypothetical protein